LVKIKDRKGGKEGRKEGLNGWVDSYNGQRFLNSYMQNII
jgi:hypothetical protein